jgi:phosphatidylserine decarboxylase
MARFPHSSLPTVSDRLAVLPQYLMPKRALTVAAGRIASARAGALTTALIRRFVARYGVDMTEAANPDPPAYTSFNEFFTRPLQARRAPAGRCRLICPVDGAISQFGPRAGRPDLSGQGAPLQHQALVGGDAALAAQFEGGTSPRST